MNIPNNHIPQQAPSNNAVVNLTSHAHAIFNIANLPTSPAYDWTTQAATAISPIHLDATFGIVIAHHTQNHNNLIVESSGIAISQDSPTRSDPNESRSSLEQLFTIPIHLKESAKHAGYIAPIIHVFPQNAASKSSIPWAPAPDNHTVVGIATIQPTPTPTPTPTKKTKPPNPINNQFLLFMFASPNPQARTPIDPLLMTSTLATLAHKANQAMRINENGSLSWLTQREQVILDQLVIGNSVRAIAESIGRSPHTVHDHVKNLHRKLGASSRGQLIAQALGHQRSSDSTTFINPTIHPQLTTNNHTQAVAEIKPTAPMPIQKQPLPLNPQLPTH